jgi:hypothetical protein
MGLTGVQQERVATPAARRNLREAHSDLATVARASRSLGLVAKTTSLIVCLLLAGINHIAAASSPAQNVRSFIEEMNA